MRSRLHFVLGVVGSGYVVLGVWLWVAVTRSPGDDNPVGLLGMLTSVVALVPARGLLLWTRRAFPRNHVVWVVLACLACQLLAVLTPVLLELLGI